MNFEGMFRTSYFAVKNPDSFKEKMKELCLHVIETETKDKLQTLYGVYGESEPTDFEELGYDSFPDLLATMLQRGWSAIGVFAGSEGARYVSAYSWVVNDTGKQEHININSIYKKAEELGSVYTEAQY